MKKERESQLNMCKTKTSCIALNFLHEDPLATKKKNINFIQVSIILHGAELKKIAKVGFLAPLKL